MWAVWGENSDYFLSSLHSGYPPQLTCLSDVSSQTVGGRIVLKILEKKLVTEFS